MPETELTSETRRLLKLAVSNAIRERVPYIHDEPGPRAVRFNKFEGQDLTPVERNYLVMASNGYDAPEICRLLCRDASTVKHALWRARRKLGVRTLHEAIAKVVPQPEGASV